MKNEKKKKKHLFTIGDTSTDSNELEINCQDQRTE